MPDDDGTLEQDSAADDDDDDASSSAGHDSGNDDDDQPGTSVGSGGDPGCEDGGECPEPPPSVLHAYAIRFGDLPPIDVGETDTGGSGGGTEIDPDTVLVVISTGADDCDDPWAALACGQYSVSFSLPPGTVPGSYALFPDLNGMSTAAGPDDGSGDCWFGGGSLEGDLELTATGDVFEGSITDAPIIDFDPNLTFSATLCQ